MPVLGGLTVLLYTVLFNDFKKPPLLSTIIVTFKKNLYNSKTPIYQDTFAEVLGSTKALMHAFQRSVAPPEKHARLPVLGKDNVFELESSGASDLSGFFSEVSHVE